MEPLEVIATSFGWIAARDCSRALRAKFDPIMKTHCNTFKDVPLAADSDKVTALVLLDLSSAFDAIDHATWCSRHHTNILEWKVLR
jgi:hypothetical protein